MDEKYIGRERERDREGREGELKGDQKMRTKGRKNIRVSGGRNEGGGMVRNKIIAVYLYDHNILYLIKNLSSPTSNRLLNNKEKYVS